MIEVDGSQGEGGGQVLRTSLALSMLTGQPMTIYHIRQGRKKPGLQAQHLKSVEAAAAISRAQVEGAVLNSRALSFTPGEIHPGRYRIDIGTAGSISLVLQTVALPLSLARGPSHLAITGGTHVSHSPCYHYLEGQWLPSVRRIGLDIDLVMEAAGFYPRGGGRIRATIRPSALLHPLVQIERGPLKRITGLSAVANLDPNIAARQKHQALRRLEPLCRDTKIKSLELDSPERGTFLSLLAEFGGLENQPAQAFYFALGEPGKRAERVADEAVDALQAFLASDGALDQYLADQLLLPLAFASGVSHLRTSQVTMHLLTNAQVLRLFVPVQIEVHGELGESGEVIIQGIGEKG
jgi:RNA 3'-terminal phosphate cyclase (ATP)